MTKSQRQQMRRPVHHWGSLLTFLLASPQLEEARHEPQDKTPRRQNLQAREKLNTVPRTGWSITEWCASKGIARSFFYELDARGEAPLTLRVHRRRIITAEADERWRREREAEALAARSESPREITELCRD